MSHGPAASSGARAALARLVKSPRISRSDACRLCARRSMTQDELMIPLGLEQDDTLWDDSHVEGPSIDSRIGCAVGAHYRIAQHLASGGMGHVFLASHTREKHTAALKVLAHGSPSVAARFLQEAELLSRQHHPNIVRALEHGVLRDGSPYLLMEYIPGVDLQLWLACNPPPSKQLVLHILQQVAAAIDHLHAQGILHRDIKPANIMLEPRRGYAVRLIDLGVSVLEHCEARANRCLVGTPAYMAPEHAAGEPCTRASDLYALGALALELLTGRPPYPYTSLSETLAALLVESVALPSERGLHIAGLDACFERALARDPEQRYATAGELVMALGRVLREPAPRVSQASEQPTA